MGRMPNQEQSPPFVDVSPLHRILLVFVNLLVFAVSCMVAFACISSIVDHGSEISFRRRSLLVSFVVNRDITALLFSLLMMVIAFTGFVGALRENVGFLQCYIQGTCLLILLDVLFVAATVALPYLTKNKAHSIFSIELIVSYRDNPDYGKLVDYAQIYTRNCVDAFQSPHSGDLSGTLILGLKSVGDRAHNRFIRQVWIACSHAFFV
ncbi:hypothetical protein MRX96_045199 [Rhipicephalus microplus]